MSLSQIFEWLEATSIGVLVRESVWGFPIVAGLHILGLTLSVGIVIWLDLRLLGLSMRGCPVREVYRRLMPWAFTGFMLMYVTGGMLFVAYASRAYENLYFRIKIGAMLAAGVNALLYHLLTERRIAQWNEAARPPLPARMAGLVSIAMWATVILAGRMMSYTMF